MRAGVQLVPACVQADLRVPACSAAGACTPSSRPSRLAVILDLLSLTSSRPGAVSCAALQQHAAAAGGGAAGGGHGGAHAAAQLRPRDLRGCARVAREELRLHAEVRQGCAPLCNLNNGCRCCLCALSCALALASRCTLLEDLAAWHQYRQLRSAESTPLAIAS